MTNVSNDTIVHVSNEVGQLQLVKAKTFKKMQVAKQKSKLYEQWKLMNGLMIILNGLQNWNSELHILMTIEKTRSNFNELNRCAILNFLSSRQ